MITFTLITCFSLLFVKHYYMNIAASHDDQTELPSETLDIVDRQIGDFLARLDMRTSRARCFVQLLASLCCDLGGGEALSTGRLELCRRAAALSTLLADLHHDIIEGRGVDVNALCQMTQRQAQVLKLLGLDRSARDITPTYNVTYSESDMDL